MRSDGPALKPQAVVSRRPVGSRHRLTVQTQVDTELRAVMDDVIEKHLPIGQETRPFENRLALKRQLPWLAPCTVGDLLQRTTHLRSAFIERANELRSRFKRERSEVLLRKIQPRLGQNGEP